VSVEEHVVVTGGASGIGLAVVDALIDEGCQVSVIDASGSAISEAEERLEGEDVLFLRADVTDEDDMVEAVATAVERFGPVNGLVTAAGIARYASVEETSAELFRQMLDVNLTGTFIACQAVLAERNERLSIVTLASVSGMRASVGRAAYGASKAGVILMSQVMAVELAAEGVRVNIVAPGPINTGQVTSLHSAEDRAILSSRVPQLRYGHPEEVAQAVLFLLSDDASYINGHVLTVDGGYMAAGFTRPVPGK
jgi:NAD(P)-dependent dehydrogenase (short-subunit alcohol dehydrogenase family)